MGKYVLHYKDEAVYEIEANSKEEAIVIGDQYWSERVVPVEVEEVKGTSRSRLDKINAYKGNEEFLKATAEQKVQDETEVLVAKIRALKPRIYELLDTANACMQNGIEINKYGGSFYRDYDSYEKGTFVTNSISHRLGFVNPRKGEGICFLGINAGGACGSWDFRTDGVDVFSADERNRSITSAPLIKHMKHFLNDFDKFESAFYSYVDKVVEKQQKSVDKIIADAQGRVQDSPDNVSEKELDV